MECFKLNKYEATFVMYRNIVFIYNIMGGMQAKGIWKQDPEANIWAQEGWELGVEKVPQWGTS